jgi:acetoacetyl-CoA synthetase
MLVYGRSDATLNPGGVRIGTAEIYGVWSGSTSRGVGGDRPALAADSPDDTRIVLFVKLRSGYELDDALADRIRHEIRRHASPRHVPARIVQVADIPRTKNGKVVELAVKAAVHGMPVPHTDALANPDALDLFRDLEELAT